MRQLKAQYSHIQRFRLVVEYNTNFFGPDWEFPEDTKILGFEYRKMKEEAGECMRPPFQQNMDLRDFQAEADTNQYRYTTYPHVIKACHEQLLEDSEARRQEEAIEAAAAQIVVAAGDDVGGVEAEGAE